MTARATLLGVLARTLGLVKKAVGVREVHFYGGLLLVGFGGVQLAIVGGVLVVHALLVPLLTARREG